MAGRFKALATGVTTLADEVPLDVRKTLKSAATSIGKAAEKLIPP